MFLQDNLTHYFSYSEFNVKNDDVDQNLYKYFGLNFHKYFGYYLDREMMKYVKKFNLDDVRNEMKNDFFIYDNLNRSIEYGNLKVIKWIFKHFNLDNNHNWTEYILKMALKQQRIPILNYLFKKYRKGKLRYYNNWLEALFHYLVCYKKYKSLEWFRNNFVLDEQVIFSAFEHVAIDHNDRLDISKWLVRIVKHDKKLLKRMYDVCKNHHSKKREQIMKYIKKFL